MTPTVLIIDDDANYLSDISLLLSTHYHCVPTTDAANVSQLIQRHNPHIVLLDLMLAHGVSGLDVLREIRAYDDNLPVVMITDYASVETAVEAMQIGAVNYLSKTSSRKELQIIIDRSLQQRLIRLQKESLEEEAERTFRALIGDSTVMGAVRDTIRRVAKTPTTVLISGESGVGKELVARMIHRESDRQALPFVAVNCAAIPRELIESELFGHEKGSFTGAVKRRTGKFELAQDGTLFLDEISEFDLTAQVKLLRVLQEREFDRVGGVTPVETQARIIAATNRDLSNEVAQGRFRQDLFYRLNVVPIRVPPLRERKDDIPSLIAHLVRKHSVAVNNDSISFSDDAIELFMDYDWPGNVRELENVVVRSTILAADHPHITAEFIRSQFSFTKSGPTPRMIATTWEELDQYRKRAAEEAVHIVERDFIEEVLKKYDGNITKAAEAIGINRVSLHRMIRKSSKQ